MLKIENQPVNTTFKVSYGSNSQRNIAYDQYMHIGEHLSSNEETIRIKDELKTLIEPELNNVSRFAAVVCPSFAGKTQLAFTLSQNLKVIYVNFGISGNNDQKVYCAFSGISNIFRKILEADSHNNTASLLKKTAHDLKNFEGKLFTLGLLAHLMSFPFPEDRNKSKWFDQFLELKEVVISELSFNDFSAKFSSKHNFKYPNMI